MTKRLILHLLLAASTVFLAAPLTGNVSMLFSKPKMEHERLRFKNNFKKPEDVVSYYCGRDASGFVWSGLLELERRAFTLWKKIPENESFFIAKEYKVKKSKIDKNGATVDVHYKILGMGDAHGTRLPAPSKEKKVTFHLKKVKDRWMIDRPNFDEIAPVVMEEKFPYSK